MNFIGPHFLFRAVGVYLRTTMQLGTPRSPSWSKRRLS